jgi:hypothetical protein
VAAVRSTAWVVGIYVNKTTFQYQTLGAQMSNGIRTPVPTPDR